MNIISKTLIFHIVWIFLMAIILLLIIRRGPSTKPKVNSDQLNSLQIWIGEETDKKISYLIGIAIIYSILIISKKFETLYH
jgi:hypothetical protein